jgi:hypothetical protein
MSNWNDFNDADQQSSHELIPRGTLAKVRMTLKPGGFDDPSQGWTGGWATQNEDTSAVYLSCEFVVLEGKFAKRKLWSLIGLFSPKGPTWGQMGRSFIRALLNSARHVMPLDQSPQALAARRIDTIDALDGIAFIARIETEKDVHGLPKNIIRTAVEPGHPQYAALMAAATSAPAFVAPPVATPARQAASRATAGIAHMAKPGWAQ